MSPIGAIDRMVTLFLEMGPLGAVLLLLLAVGSMWLGYRFSRPSDSQLSVRRPPPQESSED